MIEPVCSRDPGLELLLYPCRSDGKEFVKLWSQRRRNSKRSSCHLRSEVVVETIQILSRMDSSSTGPKTALDSTRILYRHVVVNMFGCYHGCCAPCSLWSYSLLNKLVYWLTCWTNCDTSIFLNIVGTLVFDTVLVDWYSIWWVFDSILSF